MITLTGSESVHQVREAHAAELSAIARYRRATNYLAAAQSLLGYAKAQLAYVNSASAQRLDWNQRNGW